MSTSAAFFVGCGYDSKFIGGHSFDGYPQNTRENPNGVPKKILQARTEASFRKQVNAHLSSKEDEYRFEPNSCSWRKAQGFSFYYCFLGDRVWITRGGRWFNPSIRATPPTTDPPEPILRISSVEGHISVACAECGMISNISVSELVLIHHSKWSFKTVLDTFAKRGLFPSKTRGFLCEECIKPEMKKAE